MESERFVNHRGEEVRATAIHSDEEAAAVTGEGAGAEESRKGKRGHELLAEEGSDSGLLYPSAMREALGAALERDEEGRVEWGLIGDELLQQPIPGEASISPTQAFREPTPTRGRPPRVHSHSSRRPGPYSSAHRDFGDSVSLDGDGRGRRSARDSSQGEIGPPEKKDNFQDGYEDQAMRDEEERAPPSSGAASMSAKPTQQEEEADSELGSVSASSGSHRGR